LARRQVGFGRGGRMQIEKDRVELLSGVRGGMTLGSPIALLIQNRDFKIHELPKVTKPRPGHADLAGALKYAHADIRNVLERSSARETAARTAVGAVCKMLLREFGIDMMSHVIRIGGVAADTRKLSLKEIRENAESSEVRCADPAASKRMAGEIAKAKEDGDTLGGVFEVIVTGVPAGLGSHVHYDRKLDGRLARAILSIQAMKAVEIGDGVANAQKRGSEVHDPIFYNSKKGFYRSSNHSGGIEGGMSNGEPILLRAYMKPIATLLKPLPSVDIATKQPVEATVERSDVCAVPAAGVIGEAVVAFEIADCFLEKFGGDSLRETKRNYEGYLKQLKEF
ncbi:MAG: chorismate synthase, partial [Candidatus Omnitrophota bacterium]